MQARLWGAPTRRWVAHVDMDAFFASVEQHDDPGLRGKPVIVGNSPLSIECLRELSQEARKLTHLPDLMKGVRGVVASASYEARAFGVRSAMPLARALVLCPDAVILSGRFERYREVADHLYAIWSEFSPVIEPVSIDEAYLDLTGCEASDGPVRAIGERLKQRIAEEMGLTASVGIGSSKLVAKIASDLKKPDGLVVVPAGDEAQTLAPLSVRALPGVGPRTAETLLKLHISTVGELAATPEANLTRLFGLENARGLLDKARGIDDSQVQVPGDPKSISREVTLAEDTCDLEELSSLLHVLSDRVGWMLRRDGYCARCIYIKLRLLPKMRNRTSGTGFGRLITRQCTVPVPTSSGHDIYAAAARLLLTAADTTDLGKGTELVRLLGVGMTTLFPISALTTGQRQERCQVETGEAVGTASLLDEVAGERDHRLDVSMDAIRGRYGFGAITLATTIKRNDLDHAVD